VIYANAASHDMSPRPGCVLEAPYGDGIVSRLIMRLTCF
jgi:hypothetical protein